MALTKIGKEGITGIDNSSDATAITIDNSENVGIGTASPQQKLHINGSASDTTIQITNSASGSSATDGFSLTVENPSSDVNIRNREATNMRFYTSNSERMRIDSSGRVMIGRTATGYSNTGAQFTASGAQNIFVADGDFPLGLNRQTNDGTILDIRKDGTTVGSIGSLASGRDLHVNSTGGILTLESNFNSTERQVVLGDSYFGVVAGDDNAVDLGRSIARYKDLYLSSNIDILKTSGDATVEVEATGTNANSRIQLTSNSGGVSQVRFGDEVSTSVGLLTYSHSSNAMTFRTAGGERARIDSSGNLLVGKTSSSGATAGAELRPAGDNIFTRDAGQALILRRNNNDGDLVQFNKDGTTVGSIGTSSGFLYAGHDDVGLIFRSNESIRPYNPSTTSERDASIDLGHSAVRFRNLYLSSAANASNYLLTAAAATVGTAGDTSIEMRTSADAAPQMLFRVNGSPTRMKIDANGHVTMPLQPAFLVTKTTARNNIGNSGPDETIVFQSEVFDQNSDFSSTTTFTAPVTGKYQLNATIRLDNVDTAAAYNRIRINTSNRIYVNIIDPNFSADLTYITLNLSVLADMDASDTAVVEVGQSGGTSQTDLPGNAQYQQFSGYLVA